MKYILRFMGLIIFGCFFRLAYKYAYKRTNGKIIPSFCFAFYAVTIIWWNSQSLSPVPELEPLASPSLERIVNLRGSGSEYSYTITHPRYYERFRCVDGFEARVSNQVLDYSLSSEGHNFGILDPVLKGEPSITKVNLNNRNKFRQIIIQFTQDSNLEVTENVQIGENLGRTYFCPQTKRVVAIMDNEIVLVKQLNSDEIISLKNDNILM